MDNSTSSASQIDVAAELERLRAENDQLREQLSTDTPAPPSGRGRRIGSIICAVVGAILLPFAVLTVWSRESIFDTNQYVETVAPLAQNEDIQEAITFRLTETIAEAADFRSIAEDALPPNASILAGPIESGAKSLIQQVVGSLVASEAFADLWEDVNRIGHENVVAVLKGDGNEVFETSGGRIVLKLGPAADLVIAEVDDILGTNLAETVPAEQLDAEFVLVESDDLADVQDGLSAFNTLSWLTVILAIGLLIAAFALAEKRRLGVRRVGLAIAIPTVLGLVLYSWARGQYIDGLGPDVRNPDAATAFFDITTRFVQRSFRALLVLGVLLLIAAWFAGSSKSATKVRSWWDELIGRAGDSSADREVGAVPRWVAAQQRALSIAAVVIGALALVVWTRPTGLVVLLIVIVVLLVVGAIRLIAEVGRRADTQADIQSVEPPVEPVEVSAEAANAPSDAVEQPVDAGSPQD